MSQPFSNPLEVSLLGCCDYSSPNVRSVLIKHFENLGGIEKFISSGDNVVVKPNLICPKPIDQPAQTHPAMILEMVKLLLDIGAKPIVCDSPAWGDSKTCIAALGILDELDSLGVRVNDLGKARLVDVPYANVKARISSRIFDADKVINLPKLKAHQQMVVSIAVKNMFGSVTGKKKALWHFRKGKTHEEFAKLLLGICEITSPVINIVDAIDAMEGQGPINGSLRHLGFTVASANPIGCELVCGKIIGLTPDQIPIIETARRMGCCSDLESFEVIGDCIEQFLVDDFVHAELTPLRFTLPRICRSICRQIIIQGRGVLGIRES